MFHISETHMTFIHQQLCDIRACLKSINEISIKNDAECPTMEKTSQYI